MKNLLFKILFILLYILFLMGCYQTSYYKKDFIDVKKTTSLKIGMTTDYVESILGEPHYVEFSIKEENVEEYRYFYNTRDKVYKYLTQTDGDGIIVDGKIIKEPYVQMNYNTTWGFSSESRKLILYFSNKVLVKIEVE